MDPKEFLALAKELRKRNQPAANRSAISRAYYYSFISACRFVGRECPIPANAGAHLILPRLLKNCGNADLRDIADELDKLRAYRNEADYDVDAARPEKETHVDVCLKMAEQIILDLAATIGDHEVWNQAVAAMKRHQATMKS